MANEVQKYDEKFAADAAEYASEERTGGSFLSTRGGVLSFGEEELPGNQICAVILDAVRENVYYADRFDPDKLMPPVCYAFGRSESEMAPHPSMQASDYFVPQNEQCQGCPQNEWGSARVGRGKACGNRRRLAVIPAGFYKKRKGSRDFDLEIFEDPEHYQEADMAFLKLPVTSVKEWSKYVSQLSANLRKPPYAVITRIYLEPDPKSQFKVKFELIEELPEDLAPTIMQRHEEAQENIITPYSPPDPEDIEEDTQPRHGFKGAKKRGDDDE